jgi:hypothetical protein
MRRILALSLLLAAAALPAPALAAPPANDQRAAAQSLALPAGVSGTTRDSTLELDEPSSCEPLKGSVWYTIQPAAGRQVVARLAASGDLDAVVDVFQRTRSQLTPVGCDVGNSRGQAEVGFRTPAKAASGTSYLVRVGQRANSVPGGFRLDVFVPQPPPRPPGPQLPAGGVTRVVNATTNASDAFSTVMRAGVTYRIHRAQAHGCTRLELFAPGTTDFEDDSPVRTAGCGGYFLFTPAAGEGGRYSLVVNAQQRRRNPQRYHLQVAPAREDDTAPGLPLANYQRARGSLRGAGVDVVDLYRFSLAARSQLRLRVSGGFRVQLLRDNGRRLGSSDEGELERPLSKGRYFVAVRALKTASGRYVLQRAARAVTRASITIDGKTSAQSAPGRAVRIAVRIKPGVAGPVRVTIERFDPFAGWQFNRRLSAAARGGTATVAFTPPSVGRWRASAEYRGTREAAPSATGLARLLVAGPD